MAKRMEDGGESVKERGSVLSSQFSVLSFWFPVSGSREPGCLSFAQRDRDGLAKSPGRHRECQRLCSESGLFCGASAAMSARFPHLTSTGWCGIMGASIAGLPSYRGGRRNWRESMSEIIRRIWSEDTGQDIAEYAVMLAVILVLVVGTIRLIGSNANNVFSNAASSIG